MKLKEKATGPEHDILIANIAEAEISARDGDCPKTLKSLRKVGKWGLDIARDIGVPLVVKILETSLVSGQLNYATL